KQPVGGSGPFPPEVTELAGRSGIGHPGTCSDLEFGSGQDNGRGWLVIGRSRAQIEIEHARESGGGVVTKMIGTACLRWEINETVRTGVKSDQFRKGSSLEDSDDTGLTPDAEGT